MKAFTRIPVGPSHATVLPDLDFETYSEAGYIWNAIENKWQIIPSAGKSCHSGLEAVGAVAYSEHPSTEVLSLSYDLKDSAGGRLWIPGTPPPYELFDYIARGGILEAWNSGFEYLIWQNVCHARMGWPALPQHQLRCAMAKARAHSLPGKLGKAAEVLHAPDQKDVKGEALLRKLSVPRTPTKTQLKAGGDLRHANRPTPDTAPQDYADLYNYNMQDIRAEASVSTRCPDLSPYETELWLLDQEINTRGVYIDAKALDDCIAIYEQATEKYTRELQIITGGTVQTAGELSKIIAWLGDHGVHTTNLDSDAIERLLKRDNLPLLCRRVVEIRDALSSASVKKLFAIQRRLSRDGRLRDLFAFCGADRTGRWAGRGPQPQNLPSSGPGVVECGGPEKKRTSGCGFVFWEKLEACPACHRPRNTDEKCDWGIKAVDNALIDIATRSLAHVESMWGDALAAVSGCLRGLFSAAPGHDLICSDFSAIEAVVLAELAGEAWRQEVFRTHGKIYEMSASKISGVPFEEFMRYKKEQDVHHPLRKKLGKPAELGSGYGGGWAAWCNFGADKYLTEEEGRQAVKAWRQASPMVVKFWYGLQDTAYLAVQNPGSCFRYQAPPTAFGIPPQIIYGMVGDVLYCQLPSGRMLTYHQPRLEQGVSYNGRPELRLSYMGLDSYTKQWKRLDTWGGKLTENVIQAVSRDILAGSMLPLNRAGYRIVLHVHDEIVSEVPAGSGDVAEFERIMSTMPAWATGWPVKAAGGWRGLRYRKD